MSFTEQGSWSPGWWGQCGTSEVVTGTPRPDIQGSTQSLGGEFLRGPSGEPRFNAGLIKGTVGVPGRVGDPSHWTPHYGPPGKQSLQPKRVPQINQLLLHLQDCLICIIETKEAGLPGSNDTIIRAPNQHQAAQTQKVLPPSSGIGMVSFPIDQGQEAAGIEVQVIMVRVWVQTAVRSSEKQGEEARPDAGRPIRRLQ